MLWRHRPIEVKKQLLDFRVGLHDRCRPQRMADLSEHEPMSRAIMSPTGLNNSKDGLKHSSVNSLLYRLTLDCLFPPPVRYSPKGLLYYKNL